MKTSVLAKRIILAGATALVIGGGGFYWGFLCGREAQAAERFDRILFDMANDILIRDAVDVDAPDKARAVLSPRIITNFATMVELYERHQFVASAHLRCAISRRVRKMVEDHESPKGTPDTSNPSEDVPQSVKRYLQTACQGEPSHDNWADGPPAIDSEQQQSSGH